MAIHGLGTDIVEVARIKRSLGRSEALAKRILTPVEQAEMHGSPAPDHFLAKRFAAKEACAKAFGKGIADGLSFQDMQIVHDDWGKPEWQFSGTAEQWFTELKLSQALVSISDENAYVVATVILER